MRIDAHTHIFSEIRGQVGAGPTRGAGYGRALIGSNEVQFMPPLNPRTEHTPEMLIAQMDWAGVDSAVLLQGPLYGECDDYVAEAVAKYPKRLAGVGYADPWRDGFRDRFERLCAMTFAGFKIELSPDCGLCGLHPGARLDDEAASWLWEELEARGFVLVIDLGAIGSVSYQTTALRAVAGRHPKLDIVVAHLGQPTRKAEADPKLWALWEEQIDLGLFPNVYFDTASLPNYTGEGCPWPAARKYLQEAARRIGAGKIMWGTDIPGLLSAATYPQLVRAADMHLDFLPAEDKAMVLGGTAEKLYCARSDVVRLCGY